MKVKVNDNDVELAEGATITALLERLGLSESRVAVEHNRVIIPRENYADTVLADGDSLEVLGFVGGG